MTSFEFVGVNLWFYSPSMLVGLRHSLAGKSILGSGLKPFPSRVFPCGGIGIQMLEGRDICRAIGLPASTCLAVPPHLRDGIAWERGRPARILSLWPPLGFSAVLQAATLSAGTAAARPKESHGDVPGCSKWERWLARISHQGVALFSRVQLGAGNFPSARARERRA